MIFNRSFATVALEEGAAPPNRRPNKRPNMEMASLHLLGLSFRHFSVWQVMEEDGRELAAVNKKRMLDFWAMVENLPCSVELVDS